MPRLLPVFRIVAATSLLAACALMPGRDPLQVNVADVESLSGEGFEFRMLVKLRVQNPNDAPVEYDGVYLKLDVLDKTFASGVSDERGVVPRFGEALITVPVTVSTLNLVRQTLGMMIDGKAAGKAQLPAGRQTERTDVRFHAIPVPGRTPPRRNAAAVVRALSNWRMNSCSIAPKCQRHPALVGVRWHP
jgi:LEA14-like dessication related protein